jgi:DMSO reductase family type II enzyme heme b subunit
MMHRGVLGTVLASLLLTAPGSRLPAQDTTAGKAVYDKWCAGCHGDGGAGDGPGAAAMLPRPRDFTLGIYQVRTTATGQLPTDADIQRAIDEGIPGTAMPAWREQLSEAERRDLVAYLKTLSSFFADTSFRPVPLEFGDPPGGGAEALRLGRQFYDSIGCRKCHGDAGRGDGPSAPTLEDDAGLPIFAADLTQGWLFNGGASVGEIYRRLRTGLDGTPMPTFSDLLDQQFLTDEELWRVAQYVHSLSPGRMPEVRDVVHAPAWGGTLPAEPGDSAWGRVDAYWFPLVGQVIRPPRWFAPAVQGIWVQAVHTADSLALRLVWNDRSRSPDTTWLGFAGKVLTAVSRDDTVPPEPQAWPDEVVVQFPVRATAGMERPYFLMGAANDAVYQWRWVSGGDGRAVAGLARGLERFDTLAGALGARAEYDRGQWRVVFTRSLATADSANQLQFGSERAIPMAFFVRDGSNGEHGGRLALSTWYFLALDTPTPPGAFAAPVVAMVATLGLGLVVVRRAQRRARNTR